MVDSFCWPFLLSITLEWTDISLSLLYAFLAWCLDMGNMLNDKTLEFITLEITIWGKWCVSFQSMDKILCW
jgi:hypothetical protein